MQNWQANALTTLIGSMPHTNREKVIGLILQQSPEIPVWPQLPAFPEEQMMVQYLEGLPGVRYKEGSLYIQTDTPEFDRELYCYYEDFLKVEAKTKELTGSRFGLGPEAGRTFFRFLETASRNSASFHAVKGQVVGPFTLLSGLKDQHDRALLYDDRMKDVVTKHLAMKARWQIRKLKSLSETVIVFIDEPALTGFGSSAFISVSGELVLQLLSDVVHAIHEENALAGIHVCANTDWSLAFQSGVDIINLDAYNYFDRFALYQNAFSRFIRGGGIIAWGQVPTSDAALIEKETALSLADRWMESIQQLVTAEIPLQRILSQSLFTPSCGCGSLTEPLAEQVVALTRRLGLIMRAKL